MWHGDERLLPEPRRILIMDEMDTDAGRRIAGALRGIDVGGIAIIVEKGQSVGMTQAVGVSYAAEMLAFRLQEQAEAFNQLILPAFDRVAKAMQIPEPIEWVGPVNVPRSLAPPRTKRRHYQRARKRTHRTLMQLIRRWSRY